MFRKKPVRTNSGRCLVRAQIPGTWPTVPARPEARAPRGGPTVSASRCQAAGLPPATDMPDGNRNIPRLGGVRSKTLTANEKKWSCSMSGAAVYRSRLPIFQMRPRWIFESELERNCHPRHTPCGFPCSPHCAPFEPQGALASVTPSPGLSGRKQRRSSRAAVKRGIRPDASTIADLPPALLRKASRR